MSEIKLLKSISKELIAKYAPIKGDVFHFPIGKSFKILGLPTSVDFVSDENEKGYMLKPFGYGKNETQVPAVRIQMENETEHRDLAINVVLNLAAIVDADICNAGTDAVCAKTKGKSIKDILHSKEESFTSIEGLTLTVTGKFKSATKSTALSGTYQDNYKLQDESGKTYAELYNGFDFIPIIFKNTAGVAKHQHVYTVDKW